ncbi:MAG: hypothetical protein JNG86_01480 [Verrucomicrobiaceae bacterium]|nr:hypothetical protein [Verrucomicrobiaceae bacterium]
MKTSHKLLRLLSLSLPLVGWRAPVMMLHGMDRAGRKVRLLAAGYENFTGYVASRLFAGEFLTEDLGRVPLWRLARFLEDKLPSADLAVTGIDALSTSRFLGTGWLRCPAWAGSEVATPSEPARMLIPNDDWRLIRNKPFEYSESTQAADFDEFYDRYYEPFVRARHGALVFVRHRWELRARFRRGLIQWLHRDGLRVAGGLVSLREGVVELIASGVLDGRMELRRYGTANALYFHALELARRRGCHTVFFGASRPSLHDSVWRNKRRWGASLRLHPEMLFDMALRWNRLDGAVADFLSHTSLVHHDRGGVSGLWVCPPGTASSGAALQKEIRRLSAPGLRRLHVVIPSASADRPQMPDVRWIDQEAVAAGGPQLLPLHD